MGSVVIDCNADGFQAMLSFWSQALGYVPREEPGEDWVVLCDPTGVRSPSISLQVVPEPRVGKNRLHLDLYTSGREAEVERLVGLGAVVSPRTPRPDEDFITLVDPGGNLFDVIQKDA